MIERIAGGFTTGPIAIGRNAIGLAAFARDPAIGGVDAVGLVTIGGVNAAGVVAIGGIGSWGQRAE